MYYSSVYKIFWGPKGGSSEPLEPPPLPTGLYKFALAVSAEFKAFHFRSIKSYSTIPLFRIPRFTASRLVGNQGYSHFVNSHFVNSHFVNSYLVNVDKAGIDKMGIDDVGS